MGKPLKILAKNVGNNKTFLKGNSQKFLWEKFSCERCEKEII